MKIHTPVFILGLLIFVTPFLGLTSTMKDVLVAAFGIAIMIISATLTKIPDTFLLCEDDDMVSGGDDADDDAERGSATESNETESPKEEPTYQELTEQVQSELKTDAEEEKN